jgi:RHS repeat-associated protein
MPLASTWLDLVVGADIHIELVPTPAGPVPTPFPHPFVGLVGDPASAAIDQFQSTLVSLATGGAPSSGKVLINGMPAATTSTVAKNTPTLLHLPLPPGAAFQKPPEGDANLPFGALAVTLGGSNAVRGGDPALSCSDPARLPTSSVVALPKGPPVMIGGPPAINPASAVANALAGMAVRTVWGAGSALFRYAGRLTPRRLRNLIPKAECFFTGHPVDVATGRVMTWATDFVLPGPIPLEFQRDYSSGWASRSSPLGPGWSHSLDRALWVEPGKIVARVSDGREIVFDTLDEERGELAIGRALWDPVSKYEVQRTGPGQWRLVSPEGLIDEFGPVSDGDDTADHPGLARLLRTTDRAGQSEILYSYDVRAHLVAVRDSGGRFVKLEHDAKGRLSRVLLPDPDVADASIPAMEFSYSDAGDLISARDASGNATVYEYDAHLMVRETDRNGLSFYWIYDSRSALARCVRTWGDGAIYDNTIDYGDRFSVVSDSYGHVTLYRTNELGAVTEVRDPTGASRKFEHDGGLNVIAETDPLGRVTRTSYDGHGRPSVITTPDGHSVVVKQHRDFPELIAMYQDQCGSIWRRTYDRHGRLGSVRNPLGDTTRLGWKGGRLDSVTEPGGRRTELAYDNQGNPVLTCFPNGGEVRREFDRRGRVRVVVAQNGARTTLGYDLLDRVCEIATPDDTTQRFVYDAEGNVLEEADQLSRVRFTYAGANWLVARDEAGDVVRFKYDLEGRLTEIKNERGQTYVFDYDLSGRLAREVGFDLQEKRYKRDPAGRVLEIAGALGTTKVSYDDADRMVEREYPDGEKVRFAYREDGTLLSAVNSTIAVTFERDALGRVLREMQGDHRVTSAYGTSGERVSMESSLGAYMSAVRDPLGNPQQLSLGEPGDHRRIDIRLAHDLAGSEIERLIPNGFVSRWDRDSAGRPTKHSVRTETDRWTRAYTWAGDHITAIDDSRFGRTGYQHDERGRLSSAEYADGSVQYRAPDEVGNLYRTADRADRRYVRGGVIRRDGETEFSFDRAGNLIQKQYPPEGADSNGPTWRYEWYGTGLLKEVDRPDGATVSYKYDALGRRVSKSSGTRDIHYVWDGDVLLHELPSGSPTVTWYQEPERFIPLARFDGDRWYLLVTDQVGAPLAVYDSTGTSAWQGQIDVYGDLSPPLAIRDVCPWRWPGQSHDHDADLFYNRWRYYDPRLGQYISPDPIGLRGGPAPYAYVPDPLTWIDPLGLTKCGHPGGETLSRLGASRESAARLARKASEAEQTIGIHGVSTTAGAPKGPASQARRGDVEEIFRVHDTPTRNDPQHRTVELPKPVSQDVADLFNRAFGRFP